MNDLISRSFALVKLLHFTTSLSEELCKLKQAYCQDCVNLRIIACYCLSLGIRVNMNLKKLLRTDTIINCNYPSLTVRYAHSNFSGASH